MRSLTFTLLLHSTAPFYSTAQADASLGLPPLPVPATNPQT
jgi:hypothetical protein